MHPEAWLDTLWQAHTGFTVGLLAVLLLRQPWRRLAGAQAAYALWLLPPWLALAALLPVGRDGRTPMPEIYEMFAGRLTQQQVLEAAGGDPRGQFYAHLYLALYQEALGQSDAARDSIMLAADSRFAAAGGYMHGVAVVHRDQRGR